MVLIFFYICKYFFWNYKKINKLQIAIYIFLLFTHRNLYHNIAQPFPSSSISISKLKLKIKF